MHVNLEKCLKQIKDPVAAIAVTAIVGIVTVGVNALAKVFTDSHYEIGAGRGHFHVGPVAASPQEKRNSDLTESPQLVEEEITLTLSEEELEQFLHGLHSNLPDDEFRSK